MPNGTLGNVENGQTLSDLFYKFIRMTVKTDDRDGRFKKKQPASKSQKKQVYISPNSQKSRQFILQSTSRVPLAHQHKRNSTAAYYNVSPITTENNSYAYTDDDEQNSYYSYHVRVV